jgi:hypothetical protein
VLVSDNVYQRNMLKETTTTITITMTINSEEEVEDVRRNLLPKEPLY